MHQGRTNQGQGSLVWRTCWVGGITAVTAGITVGIITSTPASVGTTSPSRTSMATLMGLVRGPMSLVKDGATPLGGVAVMQDSLTDTLTTLGHIRLVDTVAENSLSFSD